MPSQVPHCSFCVRTISEVDQLIAGAGVYICDACVRICDDILDQVQDPATPPRVPKWAEMPEEQILQNLPRIAAVSTQADAQLQQLVALLRTRSVSWTRIGDALGVRRQTAWERFSSTS